MATSVERQRVFPKPLDLDPNYPRSLAQAKFDRAVRNGELIVELFEWMFAQPCYFSLPLRAMRSLESRHSALAERLTAPARFLHSIRSQSPLNLGSVESVILELDNCLAEANMIFTEYRCYGFHSPEFYNRLRRGRLWRYNLNA